MNLDIDALVAPDQMESARELIRVIQDSPWSPPSRHKDEDGDNYEARCEATHKEFVLSSLIAVCGGSRQAIVMVLREYYEGGIWAFSPLLEHEGVRRPEQFLEMLLDNLGFQDRVSAPMRGSLIGFMTEVMPEIQRYAKQIPELDKYGGRLPDDIYGSILDDSGLITFPRVAFRSVGLVRRFKRGDGVSLEIARTICVALLTGDYKVLESITKMATIVAEEATRVKEEHPDWSASQIAETLKDYGTSKDAVQKYVQASSVQPRRLVGKRQTSGDQTVYVIECASHEDAMIFEARCRTLIDFED